MRACVRSDIILDPEHTPTVRSTGGPPRAMGNAVSYGSAHAVAGMAGCPAAARGGLPGRLGLPPRPLASTVEGDTVLGHRGERRGIAGDAMAGDALGGEAREGQPTERRPIGSQAIEGHPIGGRPWRGVPCRVIPLPSPPACTATVPRSTRPQQAVTIDALTVARRDVGDGGVEDVSQVLICYSPQVSLQLTTPNVIEWHHDSPGLALSALSRDRHRSPWPDSTRQATVPVPRTPLCGADVPAGV